MQHAASINHQITAFPNPPNVHLRSDKAICPALAPQRWRGVSLYGVCGSGQKLPGARCAGSGLAIKRGARRASNHDAHSIIGFPHFHA